ncbi:MAG: adaptor protein MecA [Velocimicrobium sp.]
MEFSRLDNDTIRCVLTEADMKEHGIELEDFFKNKEKIQSFFEEIVEEAKKQVSYQSTSGILAVQVMPLPENGLAIIFSENQDNEFDGIIKNIKDMVGDLKQNTISVQKNKKQSQIRIFAFTSLEHIEMFAQTIPLDKKIKSQLYKSEKENRFYLVLEKGRISAKLFNAVCERAIEFAEFVSDDSNLIPYFEEHFSCLIKRNAISNMAIIANYK